MLDLFARDPDILTFHAERGLLPDRMARLIVRESRLARLPGVRQRGHDPGRWRWLLPYMPHFFEHLDLSGYELVVSSSHACAAGVRTAPETLHVCYCHTPMRYVWLAHAERDRVRGVKGAALAAFRGRLLRWDRRASARPDVYVANSTAVAERIETFYGRTAEVVAPPVATGDFPRDVERDPAHFLWVHRLVPYKRPLEVAEAFRELPDLRLTMVGLGPLEAELRARATGNVELRGWTDREELARLFAGAGGFIHVGEEDFGISMVEALAAGTPVLAADRGGARDIVRPGQDGVRIPNAADPAAIRAGVLELASRSWDHDALRLSAERFSEQRFQERLADVMRAHGAR
jgi:glycosyltransferase involved in cell wall biosynthesis